MSDFLAEVTSHEQDLLKDFRNVLYLVWDHLGLPDPTRGQYHLAHHMQHGPDRQIDECFRGMGKSYLAATYCAFAWLHDPDTKILVVSASKARADDFSTFVRKLLTECPLFQHLEPPKDALRDSKIAFDVAGASNAHAPSMKSVGITGQLTGSRANLIIADDIESLNNSESQTKRETISNASKEFESILSPGGRIIVLGTPQTEETIYKEMESERDYELFVIPARYPSATEAQMIYGDALAEFITEDLAEKPELEGTPTDPDRFDEFELQKREAAYGRSGFALQFMLDTRLSDQYRYPLRLSDLIVMPLDSKVGPQRIIYGSGSKLAREDLKNVGFRGDRFHEPLKLEGDFIEYTGKAMIVDPAGKGLDATAFGILNHLNGYQFLVDWGALMGGFDDAVMKLLAEKAKEHGVNVILVEENLGMGMFAELLKPHLREIGYPCTIELIRQSKQKETRIIGALEPVMNQHRLVINSDRLAKDDVISEDLPEKDQILHELFYQMTRLTRERGCLAHDDLIDMLGTGVAYWEESMALDAKTQMKRQKDKKWAAEMKRFKNHVLGRPKKPRRGRMVNRTIVPR